MHLNLIRHMSDERIKKLEEKLAWLERHVIEQDKVILNQSRELDLAKDTLMRWLFRMQGGTESGGVFLKDERPPHY